MKVKKEEKNFYAKSLSLFFTHCSEAIWFIPSNRSKKFVPRNLCRFDKGKHLIRKHFWEAFYNFQNNDCVTME